MKVNPLIRLGNVPVQTGTIAACFNHLSTFDVSIIEQSFLSPTDEPTVYERGGGTPRLSLQSPHSIQDSQDGDTHIGKDGKPHGSHSDNSQ